MSVPLTGDLLQLLKGSTCAVVPLLPRFLNPGGSYEVQLRGFRERDGAPNATYALVSIRDRRDSARFDFPLDLEDVLSAGTYDGYDFECAPPPCKARSPPPAGSPAGRA